MSEQDKGFKVIDRRAFNPDGTPRSSDEASHTEAKTPPPESGSSQQTSPGPQAASSRPRPLPPVDFSGFILSLAHTAMMHLGAVPDPLTGQSKRDPELARHTIDTIAMLEEKTRGNLSPEEQKLLANTLTELRLAYVRLAKS